jgi:peptidoglycan/LPS O-acetylase OafA/YrhL
MTAIAEHAAAPSALDWLLIAVMLIAVLFAAGLSYLLLAALGRKWGRERDTAARQMTLADLDEAIVRSEQDGSEEERP